MIDDHYVISIQKKVEHQDEAINILVKQLQSAREVIVHCRESSKEHQIFAKCDKWLEDNPS